MTRRNSGFTLLELLASLAMVLILIVGVQQVFKIASDSVGAGQALSTAQRDNRSAQSVIYADLKNAVTADAPFLSIRNERIAAFRNKADQLSDLDFDQTATDPAVVEAAILSQDTNGDNAESAAESPSRVTLSSRNHRVDQIRFFARDVYRRQTGDGADEYINNMASQEALIWYGHTTVPSNPANFTTAKEPGIGTNPTVALTPAANPNNYYAQQWTLGRAVTLLREPQFNAATTDLEVFDNAGNAVTYVGRIPTAPTRSVAPLAANPVPPDTSQPGAFATRNGKNPAGAERLEHSRYDIVGTSISTFDDVIRAAIVAGNTAWWNPLQTSFRHATWQYPDKPFTPDGLARTAPTFIPGCSQLVVEFAGDFVMQDPVTGELTGVGQDGEVDFVPIAHVPAAPAEPVGRRVRFYGYPRNVDTSDDNDPGAPGGIRIRGTSVSADPGVDLLDVIPLADVLVAAGAAVPNQRAPFEREVPVRRANYAVAGGIAVGADYHCVWGPSGTHTNTAGGAVPDPAYPRLIRFTVGIDDVQGRLGDPQYYEYVVTLKN